MFLRCTYASFAKASSLDIVVCLEPAIEKASSYWVQNCSETTENMFLAARTLSYDVTWCGVCPPGGVHPPSPQAPWHP